MATPAVVTISDATSRGESVHSFKLELASERIKVGELIRRRVMHEVEEYNAKQPEYFRGLVQPTDAERVLNGYRLRKQRKLDAEAQCEKALEAFTGGGFFLLVDDRQVDDPEEEIVVTNGTEVRFLKLIPLAGG